MQKLARKQFQIQKIYPQECSKNNMIIQLYNLTAYKNSLKKKNCVGLQQHV